MFLAPGFGISLGTPAATTASTGFGGFGGLTSTAPSTGFGQYYFLIYENQVD